MHNLPSERIMVELGFRNVCILFPLYFFSSHERMDVATQKNTGQNMYFKGRIGATL